MAHDTRVADVGAYTPESDRPTVERDAAHAATLVVRYFPSLSRVKPLWWVLVALATGSIGGNQLAALGVERPLSDSTTVAELRSVRHALDLQRAQLTSVQSEIGLVRSEIALTRSDTDALLRIRCRDRNTREMSEGAGICRDGRPVPRSERVAP